MKRLIILVWVLLSLCSVALGCPGEKVDESALQMLQEAHPDFLVLDVDQCGNTIAAVLDKDDERILCVAEKVDNSWVMTIDNENAVPKGMLETYVLMDTENALFWSIPDNDGARDWWHYSCFRKEGVWGQVNCTHTYTDDAGLLETFYYWENGNLQEIREYRDENENLLEREEGPVIPAKWLEAYCSLADYDTTVVPVPVSADYPQSWLPDDTLRRCLEELQPGYTFVSGGATEDGLEILARDKAGALRLVTAACIDGEPIANIGAPLPEGTFYGWENFWDCVAINGRAAAAVQPYADGVWGVDYTWPMGIEGEELFFGRNWISGDSTPGRGGLYVGDHPWSDITTADWSSLPATLEEALEQLDPSRWAVVNNPNPADRLHLREKADRESRSFAKYYNGTPVEVLEKGKTWTRVRIQGINGWMMTQYLAFGKDAWQVKHALPCMFLLEEESVFPVWTEDNVIRGRKLTADGDWTVEKSEHVCIIGILGEEWYHVWFPDLDTGGMMRQSDFWPGNG